MKNREIKFRAWDSKLKVWMTFPKTMFNENTEPILRLSVEDKDVHLMQYTGLKDKNGKEIWEGDIVKTHDGRIVEMKFGRHEFNYIGFYLNDEYCSNMGMAWHWEIIGNIHENTDFLK